MKLVEICIIYNDENEVEYFKNLIKVLNLEENIYFVFQKYHDSTKLAFEKYLFINRDEDHEIMENFIILLNEECPNYEEYSNKFGQEYPENTIHIFSMNPCFKAFLISHFVTDFIELQEKCAKQELLTNEQIDRFQRIGKEINSSCNHCEAYLRNNRLIIDYKKNYLIPLSNYIDKEKITTSYRQINVIKELITYFKYLVPNIRI